MSDIEFWRTGIGRRYYESTMPGLVRELTRLNGTLERIVALLQAPGSAPAPSGASGAASSAGASPEGSS